MRSPLRKRFLSLISCTIPVPPGSGCVIVICHSPWKRILVQWCLEHNFALIVGGGNWSHRKRSIQRRGAGFTDLRNLIRHLQQKGRVILAADYFNSLQNCPVNFLGAEYNATTVHIRLARLARVPLLPVVPKITASSIHFIVGAAIMPGNLAGNGKEKVEQILSFFEEEIERDPAIWSRYAS